MSRTPFSSDETPPPAGAFLRNPADAGAFDAIYREYVSEPFPVRTLSQSNFAGFDIEVDAVLARRQANAAPTPAPPPR